MLREQLVTPVNSEKTGPFGTVVVPLSSAVPLRGWPLAPASGEGGMLTVLRLRSASPRTQGVLDLVVAWA